MKKTFKGRPVIAGKAEGRAVVSRQGFNTLASFQRDLMANKPEIRCSDQNNAEVYGKVLSGKVLCLPKTIGSTTGGMVLQGAAALGKAPLALLFSESIDSLAAGGVILAKVWNGRDIVTVDGLGDEFLDSVATDCAVAVEPDGTVIVETP
jgi:predicted aconitase with swiveling domain